MTTKELLMQEIENLPPELLTEALNLIREIKATHTAKHSHTNKLHGSTAEDLLEFAGTWSGDDIKECLQLVHDTRLPLEF
ncbi:MULTISPECIES: DUF2281 domain-containing protein [Calothrix]|uniref:DUF2281 domain-containing protein n=2 Tax=Calothrix TaxID=1186 RepID=A0ABR8ABQ7_9CYAN|nr:MULTISPECIES: DUF2281 domain-containing protein [Calothrix]MBD2197371.1 DUF2281 domain-containing protein [Calothrix parietina FACHB-288]MBD2228171.1 DUF2281 domain-containing protein [Calothrix anomala FACHB-343]